MNDALNVSHLTKDYGSFKLDDVSFSVPGGTIMGLIGENGAGKSTTIKCILNLVRRDGGEITVFGRDNLTDERAVKGEIGVVLDESLFHDALTPTQIGTMLSRVYPHWDRGCYGGYLKKFELPEKKPLKTFSRGMKMKLALAAAFGAKPRLLILDEATSGLDPVVRDEILDEFLEFIQDEDHAVLISSHITSDLEKAADYITYLHKGKVALTGAKDELLDTYGKLVCSRSDLEEVDRSLLVGSRVGQFGCEALVKDRHAFARRYPSLTVDPVALEDIMVFTGKGDHQ
ncbi:ABC transporter ATP-binding protein [Pseudoflavonifractor phocaeensis]|uniref:ABC transporter ATP-binding protein n=1 Tax=Pseudoflavonifractor phocaeensis TaxID=1870988 RepID=UPI0019592622|nr:ABC transporter ATP-binding protein [Pseudoflavonifractor phocaeensis]MBM6925244.1 ABC transporter ATP-binding protein [Pseudoflavonifractor phocaeensis]